MQEVRRPQYSATQIHLYWRISLFAKKSLLKRPKWQLPSKTRCLSKHLLPLRATPQQWVPAAPASCDVSRVLSFTSRSVGFTITTLFQIDFKGTHRHLERGSQAQTKTSIKVTLGRTETFMYFYKNASVNVMLRRETNAPARAAAKNPTALAKAVGVPGSPVERPQGRVTLRWQSGGERAPQQQCPPGCQTLFTPPAGAAQRWRCFLLRNTQLEPHASHLHLLGFLIDCGTAELVLGKLHCGKVHSNKGTDYINNFSLDYWSWFMPEAPTFRAFSKYLYVCTLPQKTKQKSFFVFLLTFSFTVQRKATIHSIAHFSTRLKRYKWPSFPARNRQ